MKYLISFDTNIVRQEFAHNWGVEKVLSIAAGLTSGLPVFTEDPEPIVIFIPTVSDYSNSLSYGGADLALRILMCFIRVGRTDIDIVLMGNESETNFLLHYDYPNILKIPGLHYVRFNQKVVASYELPVRENLNSNEYIPYLDNLGLKIPTSFKSTHSLTNEWSLFKWNSFMGFDEDVSVFENHLYFDYLITIEKLNQIKNTKVSEHLKERIKNIPRAKILLIDDKAGWHCFFKKMFLPTAVNLHCIGENFSKLEFSEIEKVIIKEVNNFGPDIVILDFRLMEDKDSEVNDVKLISGYKVLSRILKGKYNEPQKSFGRQVLLFTATSRIENILMLRNGNADGFILKEKPENYNGKESTTDVISKMISTLETAVPKAKFLIPLNEKLDKLLYLSSQIKDRISEDLYSTIQYTSNVVRQLTQNNILSDDILKLVYLTTFLIFEEIKRDAYFVLYKNNETLVIRGNSELIISGRSKCAMSSNSDDDWNYKPKFTLSSRHEKYCKDKNLNFAICALILFRLGKNEVDDTEWNKIRKFRNAIVHGNDDKLRKEGKSLDGETLKEYSLKMLDLIIDLFDDAKINERLPVLTN